MIVSKYKIFIILSGALQASVDSMNTELQNHLVLEPWKSFTQV